MNKKNNGFVLPATVLTILALLSLSAACLRVARAYYESSIYRIGSEQKLLTLRTALRIGCKLSVHVPHTQHFTFSIPPSHKQLASAHIVPVGEHEVRVNVHIQDKSKQSTMSGHARVKSDNVMQPIITGWSYD